LYVDRAFPEANLMPKTALDFARAVSLMAFLSSNVHIAIATIWRPERFTDDKQAKVALETDGLRHLKAHFERIETQLPDNVWLFNATQAGLADLMLLPFYRFGLRLDLRMTEFPKYTSLVQRAEMLPAVRRILDREKVESFLSSKPAAL
jgi:glutathione S-transferase